MSQKLPMQPIELDGDGDARFVQNPVVRFLLDFGPFNLNQLIDLPKVTKEEWNQFRQLLGCSVSCFLEIPSVDDETAEMVEKAVELLENGHVKCDCRGGFAPGTDSVCTKCEGTGRIEEATPV
jgi:hypothetical protein